MLFFSVDRLAATPQHPAFFFKPATRFLCLFLLPRAFIVLKHGCEYVKLLKLHRNCLLFVYCEFATKETFVIATIAYKMLTLLFQK